MKLTLTNSCRMGCTHCSDNCLPTGEHMQWREFEQAVNFIKESNVSTLVVSGGEPTDHPNYLEYMQYLISTIPCLSILVASNGMFLDDTEYRAKVLALDVVMYQITNDKEYYPMQVPVILHPKLAYVDRIRQCQPIGRAKENGLTRGLELSKTTKCMNIRLACKQFPDFTTATNHLIQRGRSVCDPSINTNGDIVAGEFTFCHKVGTVWESTSTLYKTLREMPLDACNKCDGLKYMSEDVKRQIEMLNKCL